MFRLILAVLLLLTAAPLLALGTRQLSTGERVPLRKIGAGLLAVSMLFGLWSVVRVVGAGEVGIPVAFGHVGAQHDAGFAVVAPWASMEKMNVRTQTYTMSIAADEGEKNGDDAIDALTKDGALVRIDATLVYHLDRTKASDVYRKLGTSYKELLRSTSRTAIRGAAGQFAAIPLGTTDRGEFSVDVEKELADRLGERGITIEDFQLRNVKLPDELQGAIDQRLKTQQAAEQQQFELQKTIKQAEIRRQEAQGLADSQRIINSTLTPSYLQYLYIEALKDTVNSPNNTTVILPFDQKLTPLLQMGGKQ